jgi:hypothetical protein
MLESFLASRGLMFEGDPAMELVVAASVGFIASVASDTV